VVVVIPPSVEEVRFDSYKISLVDSSPSGVLKRVVLLTLQSLSRLNPANMCSLLVMRLLSEDRWQRSP
jgi:hypothetical protein